MRSRGEKSAGIKGEYEGTEQRVRVCMRACVHTPHRCGPSSHGVVARRQGQSCQVFCWLCWTPFLFSFFSLLPFFSPFPLLFSLLLLFPPQGYGPGGTAHPCCGGPGRPWGTVPPPPPGAERPLLGGSRRRSRVLGISRSRDPSPRGRTFERRTCLPWQRFVPQPDLSLTRPGRGSPRPPRRNGTLVRRDPSPRSFPFLSEAVCLR